MRIPLRLIIATLLITSSGCTKRSLEIHPVGDSYFPLSVGNRWIFEFRAPNGATIPGPVRRDTLEIMSHVHVNGHDYYSVRSSWPGLYGRALWLERLDNGNLFWSGAPNSPGGSQYLLFDAEVGQRWSVGETFNDCLHSLQLLDDYAAVTTTLGRFDGAREIGGGWVDCTDFGWAADFAKGVGPVRWQVTTIAGPTNWLLVEARVEDDASSRE